MKAENLPLDDRSPEFFGIWPGTVVSSADPLKEGRIQVRVPQVYGVPTEEEAIIDSALPWARPCFPVTGDRQGTPHIPDVDAGVWVIFWGGNPKEPVWLGGFYGDRDVPTELSSSYSPEPKTRLVRTSNGHVIEMRWKNGEQEVRIETEKGLKLRLIDTAALGGLKILAETPGNYRLALDQLTEQIRLETPTQKLEMLKSTGVVNITSPGAVNVIAGGTATVQAAQVATLQGQGVNITSTGAAPSNTVGGGVSNMTFTGGATWQFAALLLTALSTLALTATGVMTLTAASLVIITTGLVSLGVVGPKFKLVDSRFFAAAYNAHTHTISSGSSAGTTTAPDQKVVLGASPPDVEQANVQTTFVEAN